MNASGYILLGTFCKILLISLDSQVPIPAH